MSLEITRLRAIKTPIVVGTARYVLLPLANLLTGYSVKAMERKIERGDWQEGKVWKRAPDGRIVIDVLGYQRWVEGTRTAIARREDRGSEGAAPCANGSGAKTREGDPRGRKCGCMSIAGDRHLTRIGVTARA